MQRQRQLITNITHQYITLIRVKLVMTSRNLNATWRDRVFWQYAADHEADVPFPVRYTIHAATWNRDIRITIPQEIDVKTFKKAVFACHKARHREDPIYDDEYISVRPRISPVFKEPEGEDSENINEDVPGNE